MKWQERITELREKLAQTDYGSSTAVKEHNAAADELRRIILRVGSVSDTDLDELLSFLHDSNLRGWIAFVVAELDQVSSAQRERCVSVIRELAECEGPEALAAQWWLRDNHKAANLQ